MALYGPQDRLYATLWEVFMRRILVLLGAFCASWALPGCASDCTQTAPVTAAAAAAGDPCFTPSAAPQAVEYQMAAPTGVEFTVGPREHARSFLEIPGNVVECAGTAAGELIGTAGRFLKCVGGKLVPEPTPTQRFVYGPLLPQQRVVVPVLRPQAQPGCALTPRTSCCREDGCCGVPNGTVVTVAQR